MVENVTEHKYVISCKVSNIDYAMSFTEKEVCGDNEELVEKIRTSFGKIERKIDAHFGS